MTPDEIRKADAKARRWSERNATLVWLQGKDPKGDRKGGLRYKPSARWFSLQGTRRPWAGGPRSESVEGVSGLTEVMREEGDARARASLEWRARMAQQEEAEQARLARRVARPMTLREAIEREQLMEVKREAKSLLKKARKYGWVK